MPLNIPNTPAPGMGLLQGAQVGGDLYSRMMQPRLARQKMEQDRQLAEAYNAMRMREHADNFGLHQQQFQQQQQLFPLQRMLMEAQAQQARASANKANAWSNILNGGNFPDNAMPPPGGNTGGNSMPPPALQGNGPLANTGGMDAIGSETVVHPGNPGLAGLNRLAGLQGIPAVKTHYDQNGNLVSRYPNGKITLTRVAPTAAQQARDTGFAKEDVKVASDMAQLIKPGMELQRTYSELDKALSDPEWSKMQGSFVTKFGGDAARRLSLSAYAQAGNSKQKELIGKVQNLTNDIITKAASVFKGPFRVSEQSLLESMKPSPSDPVEVALAKLHEMQKAIEYQHSLNMNVSQLIREKGMSPNAAFQQFMQNSGGNQPQSMAQPKDSSNGFVPMISPSGKRVMIPSSEVEAAIKAGGKYG